MGKKSTPLYFLWRKLIWVESYRIGRLWTIRVKICIAYPSKGHFEVTRGHQPSFANNFWSKRGRDVGLVSVRSSRSGESTDMQYDPCRSSRDLGLTWPEVKLLPWPFKINLYMIRRIFTRQTRWYQYCCSTFKINDFIVEKPFWKIVEFWPLVTSILTWAKKWPKWFRNDFSRAFERCLSFCSTATRSRDHGRGRSNAPPPNRRWKIQRPSRARVNMLKWAVWLLPVHIHITSKTVMLASHRLKCATETHFLPGMTPVGHRSNVRVVRVLIFLEWT